MAACGGRDGDGMLEGSKGAFAVGSRGVSVRVAEDGVGAGFAWRTWRSAMAVPCSVQCCHRAPVDGNTTVFKTLARITLSNAIGHVPSSSVRVCPGLTSLTLPCKIVLGGCFNVTCIVIPVKSAMSTVNDRDRFGECFKQALADREKSRGKMAAQIRLRLADFIDKRETPITLSGSVLLAQHLRVNQNAISLGCAPEPATTTISLHFTILLPCQEHGRLHHANQSNHK